MNSEYQTYWICIPCGKKHGYQITANATWHFARCLECHIKDAVTEQTKRK